MVFQKENDVQLINALIDNHYIKDILMKTISASVSAPSENRTTVSKTTPPIEQKITI